MNIVSNIDISVLASIILTEYSEQIKEQNLNRYSVTELLKVRGLVQVGDNIFIHDKDGSLLLEKEQNLLRVQNFSDFCLNFPHDWLDKAFAEDGQVMIDHFRSKFNQCYNSAGTRYAMFSFYRELSFNNRMTLERFINYHYAKH